MFSWLKRGSAAPKTAAPAPEFSLPWVGSGLTAEEVDVPKGRAGSRTARCVQLTVAGTQVRMHPRVLKDLVDGRIGIAESMWSEQLAFLTKVGTIPGDSEAAAMTAGLPGEALALLMEPMTKPPVAVLAGDELVRFTAWVHKLP